jgi:chloramphenicol O-acetyltransferase type B
MNTITIGNFCSIAPNVVADSGFGHNTEDISTYPFHAWGYPNPGSNRTICKGDITIGSDVWIGENVVIMAGVNIAHGAVIGLGAIVTKDVKPYEIIVGYHRVVRTRFNDKEIKLLLQMNWWDWTDSQIAEAVPMLQSSDIYALYAHSLNL